MSAGGGRDMPREALCNGLGGCAIGSETVLRVIVFASDSTFSPSGAADRTAACPTALPARRSCSGLTASVHAGPLSRSDLADHTQASAATRRARSVRPVLCENGLGGFSLLRFERPADPRQAPAPTTVGQEAEMPDPHEAFYALQRIKGFMQSRGLC